MSTRPLPLQAPLRRPVRHRRVAIAFALAVAIHLAVLFLSPGPPKPLPGEGQGERPPGPDIVARLAPAVPPKPAVTPTLPDPAEAVRPPPRPRPAPPRPRPVPPAAPPPPVTMAPLPRPEPPPRLVVPGPGPMPLPVPAPPSRAPAADLSELIAQRRRERGEPPEPTPTPREDDERARAERAIARNLATITQPPVGTSPQESGGIFQITEMTARRAEFTFFGWHRESRRRATQRIDVRLGDAPDIQTAIARRMIEIIREYEQGDFTWRSNRLNRDLVLSARLEDTGALEVFLKEEFFETRR